MEDIWVITCEFHKKFPLDKSIKCYCKIYRGETAKKFQSGELIHINLGKLRNTFPDERSYGFGFAGFINYSKTRNVGPTEMPKFNCVEVPAINE